MASQEKFLTFKGHPLVRCGNTIYYGHPTDKFVLVLQIISTKKINDVDVADKVILQLLNTDQSLSPAEQIVKNSEKKGLYAALDLGSIWLEKALAEA